MKYINVYFRSLDQITIQHIDDKKFEKHVLEHVEKYDDFIVFDVYKGKLYTIYLLKKKGEIL